jgi:hypothetical protein
VLCAAVIAVLVIDMIIPSKAMRNLPEGATEVQEYYRDAGMTGDFSRLLKARIPREEVEAYAMKVGALNREEGNAGHGEGAGMLWTRNV